MKLRSPPACERWFRSSVQSSPTAFLQGRRRLRGIAIREPAQGLQPPSGDGGISVRPLTCGSRRKASSSKHQDHASPGSRASGSARWPVSRVPRRMATGRVVAAPALIAPHSRQIRRWSQAPRSSRHRLASVGGGRKFEDLYAVRQRGCSEAIELHRRRFARNGRATGRRGWRSAGAWRTRARTSSRVPAEVLPALVVDGDDDPRGTICPHNSTACFAVIV